MAQQELQFLFGQFVPRCRHVIDKHFVDYCTLQYMDGGTVHLSVGERGHRMSGRWFWSCFAGPRIAFRAGAAAGCWPHRYLAFRGKLLERWRREGLFPIAPQPAPLGEDYAARFDQLLNLSRRHDAFGRRRAVVTLELLLIELAEARSAPASAAGAWPWLDAMRDATSDDALNAAAARSGLSPRSFRRHFKQATGLSPQRALLHRRIDRARQLLGESDLPIKAIAEELGYRDVFFFTRQFKRYTGVTPALFRRSRES